MVLLLPASRRRKALCLLLALWGLGGIGVACGGVDMLLTRATQWALTRATDGSIRVAHVGLQWPATVRIDQPVLWAPGAVGPAAAADHLTVRLAWPGWRGLWTRHWRLGAVRLVGPSLVLGDGPDTLTGALDRLAATEQGASAGVGARARRSGDAGDDARAPRKHRCWQVTLDELTVADARLEYTQALKAPRAMPAAQATQAAQAEHPQHAQRTAHGAPKAQRLRESNTSASAATHLSVDGLHFTAEALAVGADDALWLTFAGATLTAPGLELAAAGTYRKDRVAAQLVALLDADRLPPALHAALPKTLRPTGAGMLQLLYAGQVAPGAGSVQPGQANQAVQTDHADHADHADQPRQADRADGPWPTLARWSGAGAVALTSQARAPLALGQEVLPAARVRVQAAGGTWRLDDVVVAAPLGALHGALVADVTPRGLATHRGWWRLDGIGAAQLLATSERQGVVVPAAVADAAPLLPSHVALVGHWQGRGLGPQLQGQLQLTALATHRGLTNERPARRDVAPLPDQVWPLRLTGNFARDGAGLMTGTVVARAAGDRVVLCADGRWQGQNAWPQAQLRLRVGQLRLADRPLGDLRVVAQLRRGVLWLGPATLHGPATAVRLRGFASLFAGPARMRAQAPVHLDVQVARLQYQRSADDRLNVRGSVLVDGTVNQPTVESLLTAEPEGRGAAQQLPQAMVFAHADLSAWALRNLGLTFLAGGRVVADGSGRTDGQALQLQAAARGLPLTALVPTAATHLTVDAAASVTGSVAKPAATLALRSPMLWLESEAAADFSVRQLSASVRARAALGPLADAIVALRPLAADGEGVLQLTADGSFASPRLNASLAFDQLRVANLPVAGGQLHATLTTPQAGHWLLTAQAADPKTSATFSAAAADRAPATLRLRLVAGRAGSWRADGNVAHLRAADFWPPLRQIGADVALAARGEAGGDSMRLRWARLSLDQLAATSQGATLQLEAPTQVHYSANGLTTSPFLLRGTAGEVAGQADWGSARHAQLGAHLRGQLYLRFLVPFVPTLNYATGSLALRLDVTGPPQAPTAVAMVRVAEPVAVRLRGLPLVLKLDAGELAADNRRLQLRDVRGSIEGGTFRAGGEVALGPGARPQHYDVNLVGEHLPLQLAPLLVETNVALALHGDGPLPNLRGTIDLTHGRLVKKIALRDLSLTSKTHAPKPPPAQRAPYLANVGLDLHVRNAGGLDVRIDAGAFALQTSLAADLRVGGSALAPRLSGKVQALDTPAGTLKFPRGSLHLQQAVVDFEPSRATARNRLGTELALLAEGELGAEGAGGGRAYDVSVALGGSLDNVSLEMSSPQGLGRLEILSLLTTGRTLAQLQGGGEQTSQLDAALAFAGAQLSAPLAQFAQQKIEQALKLRLELGAEVANGKVHVQAAKSVSRRVRLVGSYAHGLTAEQSHISTRAQLSLTDRLLFEGKAAHALTGAHGNAAERTTSNLELKLRLFGR